MKLKHICILSFLFFSVIVFSNGVSATTITFVNDCGFTVWPGISGSPLLNITGFELAEGNSRIFHAPEEWRGQIWGRTGCTFNGSGHGSCETGDCGSGEMECNGRSTTPPVTLAELYITKFEDLYYVSLFNGYNLQMTMEPNGGSRLNVLDCVKTGCVDDLSQRCPTELMLKGGGGCKSVYQLYESEEYSCNKAYSRRCKQTPFTQLFRSACPRSYSGNLYIGPDFNISYYHCKGANYTVRFCPRVDTFSTIRIGSQLNSYDQLISILGNFTLGFFNDDRLISNNQNTYLGIWYTSDLTYQKVWVANSYKPIITSFPNHALSIDPNNGNLIITAGGTTLINITDVQAGPNPNVTATLEDNGNFRLINEIDKRVLWQSFDHQANVLLPGMKLGINMTTGQNWTLTSRLSKFSPDPGAFTLNWEPINETYQRLMIRQRGQPYWTSGNLYSQTSFEDLFGLNPPGREPYYTLTSVYNKEEKYFSYTSSYVELPMWLLTPEGRITDDTSALWTPEFCYGYDSDNGCVESSLPQCRRETDSFSEKHGEFDPQMIRATDSNSNLSIGDCFVKCWNDCSCVGFSSSNTSGTGCDFWSGTNSFLVYPNDYQFISSKYVISSVTLISSSIGNKNQKNMKRTWTLTAVSIFLVYLCLGLFWFMKKRKQKRKENQRRKRDEYFLQLTASESFKDVHQLENNVGNGNDLLLFSFASIMAATDNFSVENKLGQGGFGPVYKGKLSDGREIAIKRLSRTSGQGLVEFKNELILIAKLQHTNLVRVGCSIHGEEKMSVYEYMPNKSLYFFLFDESRKVELDWPKRFNIIEGITQGLLYLHKYSRIDLKANNILLDKSMNPKISDFGMARIFKENETQATTIRVVGTYGYMSPEYALEGTFSEKSDIFSFGVLILEMLGGRRNSSFVHLDRTYNLIGYAWELWQQGNAMELEDPTLRSTCVVQQFLRTVNVALLCVQERATDRPTTSDMISMLLNDTVSLPAPNRPAFFIGRVESKSNETKLKDCSVNNMTITDMEGR